MIRTYRAEFVKMLRRRVLLTTALITAVFAVGSAAIVLAAAGPVPSADGRGATLASLARAGGGTEVFTLGISFVGTFLFVVFVGLMAAEFSRGTVRTMLLRQPGRTRLLAGKLAAVLSFAAVVLLGTEVLTWIASRVLAPGQNIDTSAWTSVDALGAAVADYGRTLFWVTGYAVLGSALGVFIRSVPVALAAGIAWAGPFEHLVSDAWTQAPRLFPGLLLEAFAAGGTVDVSATRAFATLVVYLAVAATAAVVVFSRRDVTA